MDGLVFLVIGGFFEPAWVFTLEKGGTYADDVRRKWGWYLVSIFFMFCSLFFMSQGMKTISVGISYAIWTAVGALVTIAISRLFYAETIGWGKIIAIMMILVGISGLEIVGASA